MIDRRLGAYEIVEELGRGGMAVVYKAWQPALERYVALKVLPEYFQHDPEFLARFHREAKAAARLSHPNIVHVYDTGEALGMHYIAMEYVDGGSLRERLAAGPLSVAEAQRALEQVAAALDHAHAHGLVHRDIKPGNILFAADGQVKVTDFGIVRAADGTQLTRTGMILGTPEYMAPEQAEGGVVDHRADLYALGAVLYQMLTGSAPFQGTTPHATLHAVIYEPPPPPRQMNPALSEAEESVLLKALAKRPDDRFQSGKALAEAFRRAKQGVTVEVPVARQTEARPSSLGRLPVRVLAGAIGLVVLVLVGLVGWALLSADESTLAATATALVLLGQNGTATALAEAQARDTGEVVRATVDALEATARVLDADPATSTDQALERGQMTATAEAMEGATLTAIAAATEIDGAVRQTADALATRTSADATKTSADATKTAETQPTTAPTPSQAPSPIPSATPIPPTSTTEPTAVPATPTPEPRAQGRIAFMSERDGNPEVYVMNSDGDGLNRLTTHPAVDGGPAWSPDGRRLAFVSERDGNGEIYVMNADGSGMVNLTRHSAGDGDPAWSPNGQRILFVSDRTGNQDIHVMNADGSGQTTLTNNPAKDIQPAWSPDGRRVLFYSMRDGNAEIYVMNPDGSGQNRLTSTPKGEFTPDWSPDGRRIAFMSNRDGNREIYVMNADGSGQTRLTNQAGHDYQPAWSPDGQRMVFTSERTGNLEIYIMNADGSGVVQLTNHPAQDSDPAWSP